MTELSASTPFAERLSGFLVGCRLTALIASLAVIALLVWIAALQLPDGRLHVAFLDVGQGDAILITTPDGKQILVDGGPSYTALGWELGRRMSFWDRSLDLVILTHPDGDHMNGLIGLFESYTVEHALTGRQTMQAAEAVHWREAADKGGIEVGEAEQGTQIRLGATGRINVLHPAADALYLSDRPDDNANSIVLRLTYGRVSFLLTGDLEAAGETRLMASNQPLAAQVLKIAHHGSDEASSTDFLQAVSPELAIIQVGAENAYGHPHADVLQRLSDESIWILRTDLHGTVEVVSDGRELRVRTTRRPGRESSTDRFYPHD